MDALATTTELLAVAKDLVDRPRLDLESTSEVLHALPDDIGEKTRSSVEQALQTVAAVDRDSRYEAMARFALARVIVLLEEHLAKPGTAKRPMLSSDAHRSLDDHTIGPRMS